MSTEQLSLYIKERTTLTGVTSYLGSIIDEPAYKVESYLSNIFAELYSSLHEAEVNLIKKDDAKYIEVLGLSKENNKSAPHLLKRHEEGIELEAHRRVVERWYGVANSIATVARRVHKGSGKSFRLFYISLDRDELDARVVIEDNPTRTTIISRLSDDKKGMNEWLKRLQV